jgi:putative transposase
MVTKKWMEVNAFVIMSNHIHLVWQIQEGYERDAVQRNFLTRNISGLLLVFAIL